MYRIYKSLARTCRTWICSTTSDAKANSQIWWCMCGAKWCDTSTLLDSEQQHHPMSKYHSPRLRIHVHIKIHNHASSLRHLPSHYQSSEACMHIAMSYPVQLTSQAMQDETITSAQWIIESIAKNQEARTCLCSKIMACSDPYTSGTCL